VIAPDEELLILAEDSDIAYEPYRGPLSPAGVTAPGVAGEKPIEHLLILGWNPKIFPIIEEFDNYVGAGSSLTLVNSLPEAEREDALTEKCPPRKNVSVRHMVGEFTSRALMDRLQPQKYPTVMVLGDASGGGGVEESDTRAIIALLLLRDFRQRANVAHQEVCSEILDPKNRELAATTEIHDIVISNEMVSMVLAQITYEPRIRPVLEDLFQSEGSEIYIKPMSLYVAEGTPVTFEQLILVAKARGEVALGIQNYSTDASAKYGMRLNPDLAFRRTPFTPGPRDRLIVLAEDDG
jgi:ion channel POLLUX/CASTOR